MKKNIYTIALSGFITFVLLVPVIDVDARERTDRERPERGDTTTPVPDPTPTPTPAPEPDPMPIIISQETLEEWKADIEAGNIEKVIEEYTDIIEGNVEQGGQDEGQQEEEQVEETDPDTTPSPRTRTIRRSRNGDPEETTPPQDSNEGQSGDTEVGEEDTLPPEEGGDEVVPLSFVEEVAAEIHRLTNIEREKAGVLALEDDAALSDIAQSHSEDMAENNYFSHTNLEGCDLSCRFALEGYDALSWGENIAWRSSTALPSAEEAAFMFVVSWMNSQGHRDNMLGTNFTHEGVGVALVGNVVFATVDFARPQ